MNAKTPERFAQVFPDQGQEMPLPGGMLLMVPGGGAVLLHEFMTPLAPGDLVRRQLDGAVFRVSGKRSDKAYGIDGKSFACVPVERCEAD